LALVFGGCGTSLAQAAYVVEARLADMAVKPFQWERRESLQLAGVPVYMQSFSSDSPAAQAAETLAVHSDIFQRVLTAKNKIVLSGLQPDWHWLAEIEATAHGSKGYVSALYVDAAQLTHGGSPQPQFRWLPPHAQRQFSLHTAAKSQAVTQQIYSVALAPPDLFAYVDQKLRDDGWVGEPALAEGVSTWRLQNAQLMLFPKASAAGTSLFVHYVE
jgi:hypothetical protein